GSVASANSGGRFAPSDSGLSRWHLLHGKAIAALVAAFAAILIGIYYRGFRKTGPETTARALDVHPLTETGKARRAAVSRDGNYVIYVSREAGKSELRLVQVATDRDVPVLPASDGLIRSVHFSPDGNFLYFLRETDPRNPDVTTLFR